MKIRKKSTKHLLIIGIGGFAREVFWHAHDSIGYGTEWDIKGFLDGDVKLEAQEYEKLAAPLLGDVDTYAIESDDCFICAIECKRKTRPKDFAAWRRIYKRDTSYRDRPSDGADGTGKYFMPARTYLGSCKGGQLRDFQWTFWHGT